MDIKIKTLKDDSDFYYSANPQKKMERFKSFDKPSKSFDKPSKSFDKPSKSFDKPSKSFEKQSKSSKLNNPKETVIPDNPEIIKFLEDLSLEDLSLEDLSLEDPSEKLKLKDISKDIISEEFTLFEIEEVHFENKSKECFDEKDLLMSEDYIEVGGKPEDTIKLSPWTSDGPIVKYTPGTKDMENIIKEGSCTCILLNCEMVVYTNQVTPLYATPWNFMCSSHQREVTRRYGYGPQ